MKVSNAMYVEMQENHIAHAETLEKRIADLKLENARLLSLVKHEQARADMAEYDLKKLREAQL